MKMSAGIICFPLLPNNEKKFTGCDERETNFDFTHFYDFLANQPFYQGYYNTGWFNSKIRSRANLLICQQTNIKAQLKFFSDKVPDFRIEPTFSC